MSEPPTIEDLREAAERIRPFVHRTPVLTSSSIDEIAGAKIFFKCENLQKVGAFKMRGATNAVRLLSEQEAARGVATHSSGNHAAALALAARQRGISAHVVMPVTSRAIKKAAVASYGARIVECEPTLAAREAALERVVASTGATFIHPYNDPHVIAGAGTACLELLEEVGDLDVVLAPVGGGGLLSGTALAARGMAGSVRVVGAEPAGADDASRSLQEGHIVPSVNPRTVADGLLTSLGELTFAIISRHVERILTVSEGGILKAMRLVWERMKLIIEPSSAVPLAAVLEHPGELEAERLGIILSGGNVDLDTLPWSHR